MLTDIAKTLQNKLPHLANIIDTTYAGCRTINNVKVSDNLQLAESVYLPQATNLLDYVTAFLVSRVRPFEIWQKPRELRQEYEKN